MRIHQGLLEFLIGEFNLVSLEFVDGGSSWRFRLLRSRSLCRRIAVPKPKRKAGRPRLKIAAAGADDRLARLAAAIAEVRAGHRPSPRTAKLLAAGAPKMAQKLIEEAAETGIEAVRGDPAAVVKESVDLLYNLVILWSEIGVDPGMVWAEMDHREAVLGMAEKLPKTQDAILDPAAEPLNGTR
jgi:phosphoribosyl-ATP pyrophosphohydrolase